MSYQPIARKWRPDSFEGIVGQAHVTRTLQNAMRLGRVHHAFLFTGARGVGKTSAARVLARALNCEQPDGIEPCGACPMCVEIRQGSSPDVIEIDGASNNSVDDVRELRESVRYLPQRGKRKIYIIDEVHMLSRGAFNALLKTLEEPPEHVVFIFATTEPQKIPETILSRVQRFDFKRIPIGTVVQRLAQVCEGEGVRAQPEALRLIARAGEGSMRDSQSLLDRVISFCGSELTCEQVTDVLGLVDRSLLYAMLQGILAGQADRCLETIEQVDAYGYDLNEFTGELLELLRDATVLGLSPTGARLLDLAEEERARLVAVTHEVPPEVFVRSFQVMLDVQEQVARAPRPRMVLEMAVARLVCIRPARPVDQIVERLGEMERRLRQAGAGGGARARSTPRAANDDDEGEPAPTVRIPWTPPAPAGGVAGPALGGTAEAPTVRPAFRPPPPPAARSAAPAVAEPVSTRPAFHPPAAAAPVSVGTPEPTTVRPGFHSSVPVPAEPASTRRAFQSPAHPSPAAPAAPMAARPAEPSTGRPGFRPPAPPVAAPSSAGARASVPADDRFDSVPAWDEAPVWLHADGDLADAPGDGWSDAGGASTRWDDEADGGAERDAPGLGDPAAGERSGEDDEAPALDLPPPPPRDLPPDERYMLLMGWLSAGSRRYEVLAQDTGLLEWRGSEVVAFGSAVALGVGARLTTDPRLREGLAVIFPGAQSFTLVGRDRAPGRPTRRERLLAERRAREAALLEALPHEPRVRRLLDRLRARLVSPALTPGG